MKRLLEYVLHTCLLLFQNEVIYSLKCIYLHKSKLIHIIIFYSLKYISHTENGRESCILISFPTLGLYLQVLAHSHQPGLLFFPGLQTKPSSFVFSVFNSLLSSFLFSSADSDFISPPFLRLPYSLICSIAFDRRVSCQLE